MADQRYYYCPHSQPGDNRRCKSCEDGLVSQTGQGGRTLLPAGVEAAWNDYYASQQTPPGLKQARRDLGRMASQASDPRKVYGDNKAIANAATGTPGTGFPYKLSLNNDPAFAPSALTQDRRAPANVERRTDSPSYQLSQGYPGQYDGQAYVTQQQAGQSSYQTQALPRSLPQQQRLYTSQQLRGYPINQAQPREEFYSERYMAPGSSRQYH